MSTDSSDTNVIGSHGSHVQDNSILETLPTVTFQYRQVDDMLKEAFNYKESNNSMICDIIAMYLKGQNCM